MEPSRRREGRFSREWFVSGDLVEFDYDGYVWLHGRADEVMNAGGYRVSPAEWNAVSSPSARRRRGRRGRPGRDPGTTIIKAYVVLRDGCALSETEVLGHCAQHLASYKRPRSVLALDALPRNANGKLARASLP